LRGQEGESIPLFDVKERILTVTTGSEGLAFAIKNSFFCFQVVDLASICMHCLVKRGSQFPSSTSKSAF
jgi:hypothetical protein